MKYYPIFVDIRGSKVVVVGGGEVAERKVKTLLECGADIYLIAKVIGGELKVLVENGKVNYLGPDFHDAYLDGSSLVIAATSDSELNRRVSNAAKARNIFVNAVDQPEDCTFIVPSIVARKDLVLAISTSGKSPALAKKIRRQLEDTFDHHYGLLVELLGRIRGAVLSLGLPQKQNSTIFSSLVNSDILGAISEGNREKLLDILKEIVPADALKKLDLGDVLEG
ncbi:MAG: bifunctional precorrin-2 dehydrogenase/sirohydrochlorin ferrochelatase [Deltaproteobacteria bacterium]|nr:MAG: bifunctional precorrin-2 dehydrogenase/sirohydrochlorin ferrochelatase [Deltaproteobacteria bacterium]